MIEAGLAIARWLQFAAAALVCGVPAFALYGLTPAARAAQEAWLRRVLICGLILGLAGVVLLLLAQSAEMSGELASAVDPATLWAVLDGTYFGAVWTARLAILIIMTGLVIALPQGRGASYGLAGGGAAVAASLAWLGHGGDGGPDWGAIHLVGDILHVLAACVWIGALVVLARLLGRGAASDALHGLRQFSGVGSLVVGALVLTGILNAWALTAPRPLGEAVETTYALVLFVKLFLFAAMLGLAALNRFVLTPRLSAGLAEPASVTHAISALKRSIFAETMLVAFVIVAVAALGVMEPPSAG